MTQLRLSTAPSKPGFSKREWAEFDSWFSVWWLLLILVALMAVTYPEVFFQGRVFCYRDTGIFNYPLAYYQRESFWSGELPLWNPYSDCGIPFLAQWNTMVLYPFSLFYVLLPVPWSVMFFCFGHFLLAGAGMYFLAHRWTENRFGSTIAGLVFAWNGITMHSTMWPNSCASLGWAPWVILLMDRAMIEGGRKVVYAGLVGALQMLGGVPEIILITWLFAFGVFALRLWEQKNWRIIVRAGLSALLVAGLTAAQMLPFLELLRQSHRGASYATNTWALPPWGWANFFVPAFRMSPDFLGVFTQTEQLWTTTYYLGAATFGLALLAAWRLHKPRIWLLVGLTIIGCVFALGSSGYVYDWVKKAIPFLGIMRYPSKWVQFVLFAVPLLAAHAIAWLQAEQAREQSTAHRDLLKIFAGLWMIIGVVFWAAKAHEREDEPWLIVWQNGFVRGIFITAILGGIANLFSEHPLFSRRNMALGIIGLIGIDISFHQANGFDAAAQKALLDGKPGKKIVGRLPTVPASSYGPVELQMDKVPKLGESRAMLTGQVKTTMRKAGYFEPVQDFYGKRATLFMNCNFYDHVPKVDGLFSLYIKPEAEIEDKIYMKGDFSDSLANFLGVSQISDPNPNKLFNWIPRSTHMPLATAGQKPVFVDDSESLERLFSWKFEPAEMVLLPKAAEGTVKATNLVTGVQLSQMEFKPHRIIYKAKAGQPCLFVLAQTHYRHWKAYVDNNPVPIWRANHAFQAIEIPAGEHEVRFRYEDSTFRLGTMISLSSLTVCIAAWLLLRKRKRQPLKSLRPCNG